MWSPSPPWVPPARVPGAKPPKPSPPTPPRRRDTHPRAPQFPERAGAHPARSFLFPRTPPMHPLGPLVPTLWDRGKSIDNRHRPGRGEAMPRPVRVQYAGHASPLPCRGARREALCTPPDGSPPKCPPGSPGPLANRKRRSAGSCCESCANARAAPFSSRGTVLSERDEHKRTTASPRTGSGVGL